MDQQGSTPYTPYTPSASEQRRLDSAKAQQALVDEHNRKKTGQTPKNTDQMPKNTPRSEKTLSTSAELDRISREQEAAVRALLGGAATSTHVQNHVKTSDGASARAPANVEAPVHFQSPVHVEAPFPVQAASAPVQNHVQASVPTPRSLAKAVVNLLSDAVNSRQMAPENSATKQALAESQSELAKLQRAHAELQSAHAELQSAHAELQSEFGAKAGLLEEAGKEIRTNAGLWNEVQHLKCLLLQINELSRRE